MVGPKVYAFAKKVMVESCLRVLDPSGKAGKKELRSLFASGHKIVPHQANARIIRSAAEELESQS